MVMKNFMEGLMLAAFFREKIETSRKVKGGIFYVKKVT